MTSTQVSRAAKLVDEELEIWRNRPRDQIESLIVDARYEKVRVAGSVRDSLMMESPEAPMALHQPRGVKKVERALWPMNSEVATSTEDQFLFEIGSKVDDNAGKPNQFAVTAQQ